MEYTAISKMVRVAPRKVRAVVDVIKVLPLHQAIQKLELLPKAASQPVLKTLSSALANAKHNSQVSEETIKIKNILVDEGMTLKRRAKGRRATSAFGPGIVHKKTSHIKVILASD